eukprot:1672448-Amphidinium_carterae.1
MAVLPEVRMTEEEEVARRTARRTEAEAQNPTEQTMAPGPLNSDSEKNDDSTSTIARDVRDNMQTI